ncbi:LOW QUALITY PROTEIN: interferon-inducible protein AIM2 [Trichechus inunguis]
MESKYKEIFLLIGLDNITDGEFHRFKFFLPDELKMSTGKLEKANRAEVANLMIQEAGIVSAVMKLYILKLNYMHVAKSLQEEKEEVDKKYKDKKGTKLVKERSQPRMSPGVSIATRNNVTEPCAALKVYPNIKQKQMVVQEKSIQERGLQKGHITVMVLKAMKLFKFETQKGKKEMMFHDSVAIESEFNIKLKDKLTLKTIIIIRYWHNGFLEIHSTSVVFDAESDQKISAPNHIIRKAGETSKINKLQTQPLGKIVNGMFVIQKISSYV